MLQKHSNTVKQKRKNWQHDFCVFQEPAQWKHLRHRTAPCPSTSSHKDDLCNSVHQTKFAFLNQIWVLLLLVFCSTWCDMCFTCINIYALLHENSFIYLLSISWKTRQFIYCSINNENVFQHWERTKLTLHWHLKHFKRFLKFVLWTNLPLSYLILSYLILSYSNVFKAWRILSSHFYDKKTVFKWNFFTYKQNPSRQQLSSERHSVSRTALLANTII